MSLFNEYTASTCRPPARATVFHPPRLCHFTLQYSTLLLHELDHMDGGQIVSIDGKDFLVTTAKPVRCYTTPTEVKMLPSGQIQCDVRKLSFRPLPATVHQPAPSDQGKSLGHLVVPDEAKE